MKSLPLLLVVVSLALVACASGSHSVPTRGRLFTQLPVADRQPLHQAAGESGKTCVICVLGVALIEQYSMDSNQTLSAGTNEWCQDVTSELPGLSGLCQLLLSGTVSALESDFSNGVSPDISCQTTLNQCADPTCKLFGVWPPPPHSEDAERLGVETRGLQTVKEKHRFYAETTGKFLNIKHITEELLMKKTRMMEEKALEKAAHEAAKTGHWLPKPIPDGDQDGYGSIWTYRGLQFRGADCNDKDATVYPGKTVGAAGDATEDTNCNGISGADSAGNPYELQFCSQYPPRGLLAIGDSATAHFRLPPLFVTPADFNMTTYSLIIQDALTELDWPQCSATTGWRNSSDCPYSSLPVNSVYLRMRELNLCMHRDYVNAGVNGESIDTLVEDGPVVPSNYSGNLAAIPDRFANDTPSTVIYALIGNDVCRAHHDDGYTTVAVFAQKALEELTYLDTKLAPGSHVIVVGEIDGRVLYNTLQNSWHPIGATYPEVYDFLNCIQISPCWGWMNSNETIRNASSARAVEYNQAWVQLLSEQTFNNFDAHFFDIDMESIIAKWVAGGGNAPDLIEPTDGFHPSQTANMLIAENMWAFMTTEVPESVGLLNPNNPQIVAMFGENLNGYGL